MTGKELLDIKQENLRKVFDRRSDAYVPTFGGGNYAMLAYKGLTAVEAMQDEEKYLEGMTAVFADMWVDVVTQIGGWFSPVLPQVFDPIQHKFSTDGVTPENIQHVLMKDDEYDALIADPDHLVEEILLPRKYPRLFEDRQWAKEVLKIFAEDRAKAARLNRCLMEKLEQDYGIRSLLDLSETYINPFDILFDNFRGFKGTLLDLRRRSDKVVAAVETLWKNRCLAKQNSPVTGTNIVGFQVPHIPTYLSPKQFEEVYWPYERAALLRLANAGCKLYIMLEGTWKRWLHLFLELPKDCCVLWVDDDDLFEVHKMIGHWQIICGGINPTTLRMSTMDKIRDQAKNIIDTCAQDGGFMFTTVKTWLSPGDINQNLIDTLNFVHEYGSRK